MALSSFISSEQMFKQLNDFWHIPGAVKEMAIHLDVDEPVQVDVTHIAKNDEAHALVEMLSQYQLIPVQPWTWLAKPPADNAMYVEWDPAAFPHDDEVPMLYWTWDGCTVELGEWYMGSWRNMEGMSIVSHGEPRLIVAWQPLSAPPAPEPRKDPA